MSSERKTKILICFGTGGVGKTTIAASLGVFAAQEGKKVLVLTIDPSHRLATSLGIEGKTETTRVPNQDFKGELYASIVDNKKVFDEFISRTTQKAGGTAEILKNKLYKELSTSLSGSQEFTSLEKLFCEYESNVYDLIILDTPPAKHALDFLEAPQKLANLFNEGIAKWFREAGSSGPSFFSRILNTSTRHVFKVLESLTGSDFIRELADFFKNIEKWQSELQNRTIEMHRLLVSSRTHFFLVSSFDQAKLKEAEAVLREIKKGGYHLRAVIINRSFPLWLEDNQIKEANPESFLNKELLELYIEMRNYYSQQLTQYDYFDKRLQKDAIVYKIPYYNEDISEMQGLKKIAELIRGMPRCMEFIS